MLPWEHTGTDKMHLYSLIRFVAQPCDPKYSLSNLLENYWSKLHFQACNSEISHILKSLFLKLQHKQAHKARLQNHTMTLHKRQCVSSYIIPIRFQYIAVLHAIKPYKKGFYLNGIHVRKRTVMWKICCGLYSRYNNLLPFSTLHQGDS